MLMEPISEMQSTNLGEPEPYQQKMKEAWKRYVDHQQLELIVPPLIASSWQRCWGKVNPNHPVEFTRMGSDYMLASQTASFDLIAIARPVMEDIYQCVQNSGTAILLTNSIGCVLDVVGDIEILKIMYGWGCGVGS